MTKKTDAKTTTPETALAQPYEPTPQEGEWLRAEGLAQDRWEGFLSGRGCSYCNGTGYHGRVGVYEMLEMDRALTEAAAHESSVHFMQVAREHMRGKTILDHAMDMMRQGRTSVAEVMRVSNQLED